MTSSASDDVLLRRCRGGDRAAFGEIVGRYEGLVRALAFSSCGDRTHSEDIAQDTFVQVWRKLGDLRDERKFRPWLCSIARSQARLTQRLASRRPEGRAVPLESMPEAEADSLTPDQSLAVREEETLVWGVLERLPMAWREVLILYYREEHPTALIAEELGLSEPAVRQRLARGRALLRDRLAQLVECSLLPGRRTGIIASATLAALPATVPGKAGATIVSSMSTHLAIMTKLQAAAAGIVLAALAGAPWLIQQQSKINALREDMLTRATVPEASSENAKPGGVDLQSPSARAPRSLQELRALLTDRPSRRNTAALWRGAERLARADLERLLMEALRLDNLDRRDQEIVALLLERMDLLDPLAVPALIAQLGDRQKARALPMLAVIAPSAAAVIYESIGQKERAAIPLESFFRALAGSDAAAAKDVLALLNARDRPKALGILAGELSAIDPGAALAFLESLSGDELAGSLSDPAAVGRMAAYDPVNVARLLGRLPANNDAIPKFSRLAEAWAAADLPKALAWAEGLEFEAIRSSALNALYRTWAKTDQDAAFAALDRITDAGVRKTISNEITWEAIERDPLVAEQWIRGLQGDQRAYSLGLLGAFHAPSDIDKARELLQESIDSGARNVAWATEEIATSFAQRDPVAAASWAMTLPSGDPRQHGAEGVVRAWVAKDPVAASEWVATLPPGDARNGAVYYLVHGILRSDPSSAFRWAASVEGDTTKQRFLLEAATDAWNNTSPAAVQAAIKALPLPKTDLEALLNRL
ncbi:MAG: sigma-70 family RNA polymerase sigma factor [Verrucomicrobiota bacterium]